MKSVILASVIGAAMALSEIESSFLGYITEFGKSYNTVAEYEHRLENFAVMHSFIQVRNAEQNDYKVGHNKMSDWTHEEYKSILTYKADQYNAEEAVTPKGDTSSGVDFRDGSCLSPIQDQGQCGSCWAFSTIASVETSYCQSNSKLYKLSEQQLVDCVKLCFGCNGGNAAIAFNYFESHAAMSEASYAYTAKDGTCEYSSSSNTGVMTTGFTNVTADTPSAMKAALNTTIMSVAIQADQRAFQAYSSGIFTDTSCGTQLDHATNVVGWGTEGSMEYWVMRNSWGTSWGDSGYMRLQINDGVGLCGIQMQPQWPATN